MKAICITGFESPQLVNIFNILLQSGMAQEKPINGHKKGINDWHSQLLRISGQAITPDSHSIRPGKTWERLAGDIFLNNINNQLWGWVDSNSAYLLDFWLDFDTNISFIFVFIDISLMVTNFLSDQRANFLIANEIEKWTSLYEKIFDFYFKNKDRCIIINAEQCLIEQKKFIQQCNDKFGTKLYALEHVSVSNNTGSQLALYLSDQLIKENKAVSSLNDKAISLGIPLKKCIKNTPSKRATINNSIMEIKSLSCSYTAMQEEQKQLNTIKAHYAYTNNLLKSKLDRSFNDNKLLFANMINLQDQFQTFFKKYLNAKQTMPNLQKQQNSFFEQNPCAFTYEHICHKCIDETWPYSILWELKGVDVRNKNIPRIQFTSFIKDGIVCLKFSKHRNLILFDETIPFFSYADIITIIPKYCFDNKFKADNAIFSVSTTAWVCIKNLYEIIYRYSGAKIYKEIFNSEGWSQLRHFSKNALIYMHYYNAITRYDSVELIHEVVNCDYECLILKLHNLYFSGCVYDFEFRLSCAHTENNGFGNHPKIEFPITNAVLPFERWFEESRDEFGPKLELRFASPNKMDLEVYSSLSSHDKYFISELITHLPGILFLAQRKAYTISRSWEEWSKLAATIYYIFHNTVGTKLDHPTDNYK